MKKKRGSIETYRLISKLSKSDILALSRMTCKEHGHSYLVHPNCALKEGVLLETTNAKGKKTFRIKERIGFLDIENFSFYMKADMGIVLSYCIKELDGPIIANALTMKELQGKVEDRRLLKDLIKDMEKFTRLIGFYSTRFDFPFVRTRCLMHGYDFPIYKSIYHTDIYYLVRNKFCLKSNRLQNACKQFGIPAKDTHFEWDTWKNAVMKGSKKDLNKILEHNKEDVISTELLWKKVSAFGMESKRSI